MIKRNILSSIFKSFSLNSFSKGPLVNEAFYDSTRSLIIVSFDKNIQCSKECSRIFEDLEAKVAKCFCKGDDRMKIRFKETDVMQVSTFCYLMFGDLFSQCFPCRIHRQVGLSRDFMSFCVFADENTFF